MHDQIDFDVIIIGAGLSGLTAAHTILEKEPTLNVLILESSERIGGRILSTPIAYKNGNEYGLYNIGGSFINCSSHIYLLELLKALNIKPIFYEKINGKHILENKNGKLCKTTHINPFKTCSVIDRFQLFRFFLELEEMYEDVSFSNPFRYAYLDYITLDNFMERWFMSGKAKDIFRSLVLAKCGIKTTQISALFYLALIKSVKGLDFLQNNQEMFFIEGGSEKICYAIRKKFSDNVIIKTNNHVIEIKETNDGMLVKTHRKVYQCSIIAIQLSNIKNINCIPKLPHVEVFCNVLEGCLVKFVVTYTKAFWKTNGFSGTVLSCTDDGPILKCYDITVNERPALSGFIYNTGRQEEVLKQLAKYFGEEALKPVSYYEKKWNETGNPMCCLGLKTMIEYSRIFLSNSNRIFWASSEITDYYYGHMEGAVYSGFKAAIQVLYDYRPSAIQISDIIKLSKSDVIKPVYYHKNTLPALLLQKKIFIPVLLIFTYLVNRFSSSLIKK